jgi:HK97 family phage major capsid protein
MALKQLMLGRERREKADLLAAIEKEQEELRAKREAWKIREAAAEKALEELEGKEDATEEERKAFDDEAAEIEAADKELTDKEADAKSRADAAKTRIGEIDAELEELKKRFEEGEKTKEPEKKPEERTERGVQVTMSRRERIEALVKREDVKGFLDNVRGMRQRGVAGADVAVPVVLLPMVAEASGQYGVLEKYLDVENITGEGAQNVLAGVPEAVWTETKGWVKELDLNLYQMKTYGNMVAGLVPVHESDLEDSDENLAAVVIDTLGKSIGRAKDKAILYGNGVNMPVGIATRLAATEQPAWWNTQWVGDARPAFTNLSASNIGAVSDVSLEAVKLFREMATVLGAAKNVYDSGAGGKFWAMSSKTWNYLQVSMLSMNAAGAIVTAASKQMPIIGGAVEELDFIPDGVVIGGWGGNYKWVNRRGMKISPNEYLRWMQNQILYKGVARADGVPMAGEAFAMFNVMNKNKPTASMNFEAGKASREEEVLGGEDET